MYRFILVLLLLIFSQAAFADFWVGFGQMKVDKIYVADEVQFTDAPEALTDNTYNTLLLGIGSSLRESLFGISADLLLSESKKLADVGTRPLVGGGSTRVSKVVSHYGLFIGARMRIQRILVLSAGVGQIGQEASFSYDPSVSNPGGAATDEYFHSKYVGAELFLSKRVLLGVRKYSIDPKIALTTFSLTASF
jgi:hypothetical protein